MAAKNKEQLIQTAFQQFQPVLVEGLAQLFQQEFKVAAGDYIEDPNSQFANQEFPLVLVSIKTGENGAVVNHLAIPMTLALNLYGWMLGKEAPDAVSEEVFEGLQEGTNQIIGQLQAAVDGTEWQFQVENVSVKDIAGDAELAELAAESDAALMTYNLDVTGEAHTIHQIIQGLDSVALDQEPVAENDPGDTANPDPTDAGDEEVDPDSIVDVHRAEFDTISGNNGSNGTPRNIDMLLDVELEIYVELGRKRMKIQDLLKLGKGSLIELDRSAGEPLSIFIGDKRLAEGEVVVVDDRFGIRITQLIGPKERLKSLV